MTLRPHFELQDNTQSYNPYVVSDDIYILVDLFSNIYSFSNVPLRLNTNENYISTHSLNEKESFIQMLFSFHFVPVFHMVLPTPALPWRSLLSPLSHFALFYSPRHYFQLQSRRANRIRNSTFTNCHKTSLIMHWAGISPTKV